MEIENQVLSTPSNTFQEKPAPPAMQMNSQGELIEVAPTQSADPAPIAPIPSEPEKDWVEDCCLGETVLAEGFNDLCEPTDDTGMEHKIISCGHVLKSTHDLARWSEKTGARRVNSQDSIDAVSDLVVNLERPPRIRSTGGKKDSNTSNASSTDNTEGISELFQEAGGSGWKNGKKGNNNNNKNGNRAANQQWQPVEKSEVINCWPVLKSTHDQALLAEKRGKNAVNKSESSELLDELALNQRQKRSNATNKQRPQQKQQQKQPQQQQWQQQQQPQQRDVKREVVNCWPLLREEAQQQPQPLPHQQAQQQQPQLPRQGSNRNLHSWKSAHDRAVWFETHNVKLNASGASDATVENGPVQAGGGPAAPAAVATTGQGCLQSGMDTQAGSHVQLENEKLAETPDSAMAALHLHV